MKTEQGANCENQPTCRNQGTTQKEEKIKELVKNAKQFEDRFQQFQK